MPSPKSNPLYNFDDLEEPAGGADDEGTPQPPAAPDDVEVQLDEEDDEDDEPAAAAPDDEPAPRPPRKERRANRFREAHERADRAEAELAEERKKSEETLQRLARLEGAMGAMGRQSAPDQPDPDKTYRETRDALLQEADDINERFAALPEDQQQARRSEFRQKIADVDDRLAEARTKRYAPAPGESPDQAAQREVREFISANPDVVNNPEARGLAQKLYAEAVQVHKIPPSIALAQRVFGVVRDRLGIKSPFSQKPTASDKARYTGFQGRGAQGDGARTVRLSRHERDMAVATYPDLSEEKACAKWYKEVASSSD